MAKARVVLRKGRSYTIKGKTFRKGVAEIVSGSLAEELKTNGFFNYKPLVDDSDDQEIVDVEVESKPKKKKKKSKKSKKVSKA